MIKGKKVVVKETGEVIFIYKNKDESFYRNMFKPSEKYQEDELDFDFLND